MNGDSLLVLELNKNSAHNLELVMHYCRSSLSDICVIVATGNIVATCLTGYDKQLSVIVT